MAQKPGRGKLVLGGQLAPPASSCNFVCLSSSVIVTEKTNILLRYLHQQWDKKVRGFGCWDLGKEHGAQQGGSE